MENMTAKASCFARAYHAAQPGTHVFYDPLAKEMLGGDYDAIAAHMAAGAAFFCPGFEGSEEQALCRVVAQHLAPSPLGRAAFAEDALKTAVRTGARQYLLLAAGYDTFAYRREGWAQNLAVFELDYPQVLEDKYRRATALGDGGDVRSVGADLGGAWMPALLQQRFDDAAIAFCSMLGIVYYLQKDAAQQVFRSLGALLSTGSAIAFDYPQRGAPGGVQAQLAAAAGEPMQQGYAYAELERLLESCGFLIYEHLNPEEITQRFFEGYNAAAAQPMYAAQGVNYCLAVRR